MRGIRLGGRGFGDLVNAFGTLTDFAGSSLLFSRDHGNLLVTVIDTGDRFDNRVQYHIGLLIALDSGVGLQVTFYPLLQPGIQCIYKHL